MLKKNVLKFSLFVTIGLFTVYSAAFAQEENIKNPYDSGKLSVNQILATYHEHVNETFNNYIALMLEAQERSAKNPGATDDPNGKPLASAAECLDSKNNRNYSTFCLSVNLLGGNSDECSDKFEKTWSEDFRKFCQLGGGARPLRGYLNFKAALEKKRKKIYETAQEETLASEDFCKTVTFGSSAICEGYKKDPAASKSVEAAKSLRTQRNAIEAVLGRQETIDKEIKVAKATLDQTLSAYDQLRLVWPMHVRYKQIYKDLKTYRDKLVDIRQQTDSYPSKFKDLTTSKCL